MSAAARKSTLSLLLLTLFVPELVQADDWPQWRGPRRDGTWSETGLIQEFSTPEIEIKWRVPIGSGYTGPTVADGRVYVMDRMTDPGQVERVHCFDEQTGKPLWSFEYDCVYTISYEAGPRAAVTIDDGRAYALGAMGHLHCFDAASGKVLWKRDLGSDYEVRMPIWGISASPLIWNDSIILQIGGTDACVVALDKTTGEENWRALDDRAQYAAPVLVKQGDQEVVVCWTGDSVAGLSPSNGQVFWRIEWTPKNMPIGVATPVVQDNRLFMTSFYDGSHMIQLSNSEPTAETAWLRVGQDERNTDALQSIISTPIWIDGYIYGVDSYGELRCLDARNGERIWEDLNATPKARWSTIHFVKNGELIWMFNERGELIISRLNPEGYVEISRAKLIEPTTAQLRQREGVCWSHPAFANRHVFARNDKELVCASLEAK